MVELCWEGETELKQDRQFTYNVKLMRFHATITAVEKQLVLYIVSVST